VGAAVVLAMTMRSEFPQGDEETLAMSRPAAAGQSAAAAGASAGAAAAPRALPSEEEFAKSWPRFRGPEGLGVSAYANVPQTWDAKSGKGIVWKMPVPLPGNNSPVVWGKRVFLSGADQRRREVYCFDAEKGKLLWQQAMPSTPQSAAPPKVNEDTGYAASTTATDGRYLFAIFANGDLAAWDFSGRLAWSKSLGLPENSYGHASSLATYKDLLLVQLDQGSARSQKSKLLAFDGATGKIVWQVPRPVPNSWATPIVIRNAGQDQIVAAADPWVIGYNAADGKETWRAKCLKTDIGPSPVFADGKVFAANDNCNLVAIPADGHGDVTQNVLWKGEDGLPDTCSPLATKEFVLLLTSFGTLTCYDAAKGDMLWAEDFSTDFSASPSLVGNRVYLIGRKGKAWIVEPTRQKCNRLGEADLREECVTSPAFQDGRVYLRGKNNLFCLGK
jgi:outer membrane protein assembly factor BamB